MRAAAPAILATPALLLLSARVALAEPSEAPTRPRLPEPADRFELLAQSQTYATLFRRALAPGPSGSLLTTETIAPIYEYIQVRARDLDSPWHQDSVDIELSGWARGLLTDNRFEQPFDGDVQTAFVAYHQRDALFRLGRQQFVGGAARFARFDGALLSTSFGPGFSVETYAGMTVLPRWNERTGYHHLGSEADSLLRAPDAFEQPRRAGNWLAGARLGYSASRFSAAASFHEQRETSELAHRNLGLDVRANASPELAAAASAILDADARRLADARAWLDWGPTTWLQGSLEYLHTEPALWLSRQAVLSVFSNDRFDELGGTTKLRVLSNVSLEGMAFATLYDDHRPGGRGELTARLTPDSLTLVRVAYSRVLAPKNGYHSLRSSLSRRFPGHLAGTLDAYAYFYDHPISGFHTSVVYACTLTYEATARLSLLWGSSLTRSPYASLDAQTLLRASYAFDYPARGLR